jgi:hypothetical protein
VVVFNLLSSPLPFLVLGEDLPAGDVAILGPDDLIFDEFGGAVVLGAVKMGQFLYKFIHVVLPGSIQSPLAEGTRGQSGRPQDLQLH